MGMLIAKAVAVLGVALGLYLMRFIGPIKKMIWAVKNGFGFLVSKIIGSKMMELYFKLSEKILAGSKWAVEKILRGIGSVLDWINRLFVGLPDWAGGGAGGIFEKGADVAQKVFNAYVDGVLGLIDAALGGAEKGKEVSANAQEAYWKTLDAIYPGEKESKKENIHSEIASDSTPEQAADSLRGSMSSTEEEEPEANATSGKEENSGGLLGTLKDAALGAASKGAETLGTLVESDTVQNAIEVTSDKVSESKATIMKEGKAILSKAKSEYEDAASKNEKKIDDLHNDLLEVGKAVKEGLVGKSQSGNDKPHYNPPVVINFKASADQQANLNSQS
jgi:hypothetical protein